MFFMKQLSKKNTHRAHFNCAVLFFPARERESLSLSFPHSVMFLKGFHVFSFVK